MNLLSPPLRFARRCWQSQQQAVVGVDVGMQSLAVVQVTRRAGGFHWHSRGLVQYANPLVDDESGGSQGLTPARMQQCVQDALPRPWRGSRRRTVAILPPGAAVIRWPNEGRDETLQASLRADLGATLGAGDSIESCSWTMGDKARPMIYAVSGGLAASVATGIYRCGYSVPRVDSRPHVLARALALHTNPCVEILIEWGWSDCTIVLAKPNAPGSAVESRRVPQHWPQPILCRTLRGYSLSAALRTPQHSTPSSPAKTAAALARRIADQSHEALRPLVQGAAGEIQRTLRYAQGEHDPAVRPTIVLCGLAASTPAVAELLSVALGRPVERWRWAGATCPLDHAAAPDDCLFALALAAACGEAS